MHALPEGDATFAFDATQWRETQRTEMLRTERDPYAATFLTLDRER